MIKFFKKYYSIITFITLILLGTIVYYYLDNQNNDKYTVVFVDDLNDLENKTS